MKVEFTELNPWGLALVVEYKEFIKGKEEYKSVLQWVEKMELFF